MSLRNDGTGGGIENTITLSLTQEQTKRLAQRMYWDVNFVYDSDGHIETYKAGKFFTVREVTT